MRADGVLIQRPADASVDKEKGTVNGNQKCSDFGNSECSIFGIKTTVKDYFRIISRYKTPEKPE